MCMVHVLHVNVLCQPMHSCIEPSLHQLDFYLEIFLWRLKIGCTCKQTSPSVLVLFPHSVIAITETIYMSLLETFTAALVLELSVDKVFVPL